jgi:hypothetical protein
VPFYRESSIDRDILFPRHGADTLKKLIKAVCVRFTDDDQNTFARTQVDVRLRYIALPAGKQNPPVFGADTVYLESFQFVRTKPFKPEQTWNAEV